MQVGPLHELMKPVCWLIGTWKSICAVVNYPTMKGPVKYCETMSFISLGRPMLSYKSETWEAESKAPMHMESGFMRVQEDCTVHLTTAQSLGLITIEVGKVKDTCIDLKTQSIPQTRFVPKDVVTLVRQYSINKDGQLQYSLFLRTCDTPLTEHGRAVYEKLAC